MERLTIRTACEDNHVGDSTRKKKNMPVKIYIRRQHPRIGKLDTGRSPEKGGKQREMEEAGCKVICDTPTGEQTTGMIMVRRSIHKLGLRVSAARGLPDFGLPLTS